MARNRRKMEGEVTFSWFITRVVLFVLAVACGLGIVFLKNHTYRLGGQFKTLEGELAAACKTTSNLEAQLADLKTPRALEAKMTSWGIVMVRPSEMQIRRLPDPSLWDERTTHPRMIAQADVSRSASRTP